jgi:transposase
MTFQASRPRRLSGSETNSYEEAFRTFGGSVKYVVLDNLKQGVIRPDLYEPAINPVYAAMLAHYAAVADAARVGDPNRKDSDSYCTSSAV